MIELPPGWLKSYQAAADKAAFLRGWADQIYLRTTWTTDPDRLDDLVTALGGALGSALNAKGTRPPGPQHGDILRTYSGRMWPDPDVGPWLITLTWQVQGRKLVCIGMEMTSARDAATTDHGITEQLGNIGTPLTASVLRSLPLGSIVREDRDEMVEAAEALKPPKVWNPRWNRPSAS